MPTYRFDAPEVQKRLKKFSGPRKIVYYDKELQNAKVGAGKTYVA